MAENMGKPWTIEEDQQLRELVAQGATLPKIARTLNRTESGTKTRAYILRLALGRAGARRRSLSRWG
jgi:hypothetical protein